MPFLSSLLTLLAGLFGGYLGAYMAKKGENKAIHEDIEKLVDQVKAVTTTTEEIKSSISTEAWKRDLKKEACYELLKQLEPLSAVLAQLLAAHQQQDDPEFVRQTQIEFAKAYGRYMNAQIVVEMVGSEHLRTALRTVTHSVHVSHGFIKGKLIGDAWASLREFSAANEALMNACRKELGFEETTT